LGDFGRGVVAFWGTYNMVGKLRAAYRWLRVVCLHSFVLVADSSAVIVGGRGGFEGGLQGGFQGVF